MLSRLGTHRHALLLTGVFLALLAVGASRHELWRDEALTWLFVRSTDSLLEVLAGGRQFGHPPGWYVALYLARQVADTRLVLPAVNLAVAGLFVFVFALAAPFPRHQKWLFAIGFFPLFQYGLVCRPYGILVLLLFLYAALRSRLRRNPIPIALMVGLLPLFHVLGILLALGIVAIEGVRARYEGWPRRPLRNVLILGLALSGTALTVALLAGAGVGGLAVSSWHPLDALRAAADAFLPQFEAAASRWTLGLGLLLWLSSWLCFGNRSFGFALYGLWTGSFLAFSVLVYRGFPWHHGLLFVGFLTALWVDRDEDCVVSAGRSALLTLVLVVQAAVGVYAYSYDLRRPLSNGAAAADLIERRGLEEMPIVGVRLWRLADGTPGFTFDFDRIQSALVYLNEPRAFDPRARSFEAYWRHYVDPDYFMPRAPLDTLPATLAPIAAELGSDLLVIVARGGRPTAGIEFPSLEIVAELPRAALHGETLSLFLYRRSHSG